MAPERLQPDLDALSKDERIKHANENERLGNRRFLLPESPELRERLHRLHRVFEEAKHSYPELIAFNLYGSQMKGYANKDSDIDMYVGIDEARCSSEGRTSLAVAEAVKGHIMADLGISDDQLHLLPYRADVDVSFDTSKLRDSINEQPAPEYLALMYSIAASFMLSVGNAHEVWEYRKRMLDYVEGLGEEGKELWIEVQSLWWSLENWNFEENWDGTESIRDKRAKLYPWSLEDVRKYFDPAIRKFPTS